MSFRKGLRSIPFLFVVISGIFFFSAFLFPKANALKVWAQVLPPPIEGVSPLYATQGDTGVALTITLSQQAMLPPGATPMNVRIGTLEGGDISINGLQIMAVFDIPVNEPTGMKEVSIVFPAPPMDPNAQPMIFTKADAFGIDRGYTPFTIGATATDPIVTDIPVFTPGGLYDEGILRTIYLEFSQEDWWEQLEANYAAEENILADLTMEGIVCPDVGVRFKGMTSYMMTGNSRKKSFNIEIDATDPNQRLMGYKTLNLNNASQDPSFIREVLYFHTFRKYAPCPQANFVKLVINGEDWGIYANVQQQNADLIKEWFGNNDGDRWKTGMGNGGFFFDANTPQLSFEDWLATPMAQDLNQDGQINEDDYNLFIYNIQNGPFMPSLPAYEDWVASPMAQDLNSDGQITEADYDIFVSSMPFPPGGDPNTPMPPGGDPNTPMPPGGNAFTYEQWMASPMAQDLNSDGQITEADYDIFISSMPFPPGGDPNMPFPPGGGMMMGGGESALTWLGSDVTAYQQAYELKSEHTSDPWAHLITACNVLNNTPSEQLADAADAVLAVDRWLWFLAMENIFTDEDSYLTKGWDYQLYYDPKTGQIHPLQHDGNETFIANFVNQDPFEGENYAVRPVISRLLAVPQFRERYLAHIRTIIEESLDWDTLVPQIEAYRALIADEVMADTKKLYSNDQFVASFTDIQNFINGRRNYLLNDPEINRPTPLISSVVRQVMPGEDISPLPGQPVWIIAFIQEGSDIEQGVLYYTAGAGPFEHVSMFFADATDSGFTGDIMIGQILPRPAGSRVRYYVEVRTAAAGQGNSFVPHSVENDVFTYRVYTTVSPSPPIVINELMTNNQSIIQDPQGEYDDWIELMNVGDQEIDLSGMYLSDKEDNPLKWEIPEGTVLAPGAYLIIWADEDCGDTPGLHANFRLSTGGEMVLLTDKDAQWNVLLDSVVFEAQDADVSYGRFPDGTGQFRILSEPTPNDENINPVPDNNGKDSSASGSSGGIGSNYHGIGYYYYNYGSSILQTWHSPQTQFVSQPLSGLTQQGSLRAGQQNLLTVQSGFGYPSQGVFGLTQQNTLGYGQQNWTALQNSLRYPFQGVFGLTSQGIYGSGQQNWSGLQNWSLSTPKSLLTLSNTLSLGLPSWYGYGLQTGYGFLQQNR